MKNREYWEKRAEQNILRGEKKAEEIAKQVEKLYKDSIKDIENEINRFYVRFGMNQGLTLAEVKKALDPKELKSFREQAKLYYDEAYKNNWETAYTKRMKLLSARAYMSRLEELKVNIYHVLQRIYEGELGYLSDALIEQYKDTFEHTMYDYQTGLGFGASFTMPSIDAIQKALNTKFFSESYSKRIWDDRDALVRTLEQEIPRAFALGENPKQTAKRIRDNLEPKFSARTRKGRRLTSKYERLARTEMNKISNEASFEATTEVNRSMKLGIEKYRYLATLDSRTSEKCRNLDSKVFELSEKQIGVNFPPAHSNCRSTYVMVFDDEEITERIAKDKSGKYYYVPSNMSFREWQAKYGDA